MLVEALPQARYRHTRHQHCRAARIAAWGGRAPARILQRPLPTLTPGLRITLNNKNEA